MQSILYELISVSKLYEIIVYTYSLHNTHIKGKYDFNFMIDLRGRGGGGGVNIKKILLIKFKNKDFSSENELVIVHLQRIRLRNKKNILEEHSHTNITKTNKQGPDNLIRSYCTSMTVLFGD